MNTIAELTPGQIMIENLYSLYHLDEDGKPKPYKPGQKIFIHFNTRSSPTKEEINQANEFAIGLKKVILEEEACIRCNAGKVTIIPTI